MGDAAPADTETIVVTGVERSAGLMQQIADTTLYAAPAVAALLLLAIFIGPLRRFFARTPFATFVLALGATLRLVQHSAFLLGEEYEIATDLRDRFDMSQNDAFDLAAALNPMALLCAAALAFFVLARLRALFDAPPPAPAHAASVDALPDRPMVWRSPLSFASIRDFLETRRNILRNPGEALRLVARADFNPLGFKIREAVIAGLPASALGATLSVLSKIMYPQDLTTESVLLAVYDFAVNTLQPFLIPISLLLTSTVAGWSLVAFRPSQTRLARQLYLTTDAARSFIPEMIGVLTISIAMLAIQDEDVQRAIGDLPDDAQSYFIAALVVFWSGLLWLMALRLYVIPAAVVRLLGRDKTGRPFFALLRHTLTIFVALPVIGVALGALTYAAGVGLLELIRQAGPALG